MQSRSFFYFGSSFSFMTSSVFAGKSSTSSGSVVNTNYLITENSDPLLTEAGDHLIIE